MLGKQVFEIKWGEQSTCHAALDYYIRRLAASDVRRCSSVAFEEFNIDWENLCGNGVMTVFLANQRQYWSYHSCGETRLSSGRRRQYSSLSRGTC